MSEKERILHYWQLLQVERVQYMATEEVTNIAHIKEDKLDVI